MLPSTAMLTIFTACVGRQANQLLAKIDTSHDTIEETVLTERLAPTAVGYLWRAGEVLSLSSPIIGLPGGLQ